MDIADIQMKTHEIVGAWMNKLNTGESFSDLMQVYGDIRVELSHIASNEEYLIDTYIELIEKEKELFSPEAAYLAGQKASQAERKYYPLEYIGSVILEHDNQSLLGERDSMYNALCDLLGEPHLMDEFNELFRYCHGEINRIIEQFYHWGYYGNIPDIKAIAR